MWLDRRGLSIAFYTLTPFCLVTEHAPEYPFTSHKTHAALLQWFVRSRRAGGG